MDRVCRFALLEEFRERNWVGRRQELDLKLKRDGLNALPTLGRPHYAAYRQCPLLFEKLSHRDIRSHHETFDDVLSHVVPADGKVFHLSIFDYRVGFHTSEGKRPVLFADTAQPLRDFLLQTKLCFHP